MVQNSEISLLGDQQKFQNRQTHTPRSGEWPNLTLFCNPKHNDVDREIKNWNTYVRVFDVAN